MTFPLWLIFVLQAILVCGAFAAVIIVMTVQFNTQYTNAVHDKLILSQEGAAAKILDKFNAYDAFFEMAAKHYMDALTPKPLVYDDSTLISMQGFYDEVYIYTTHTDILYVYQGVYSNFTLPRYNRSRWTLAVTTKVAWTIASNGTMFFTAGSDSPPWDMNTFEPYKQSKSFEIADTYGYDKVGWYDVPFWSSFLAFTDPFTGWKGMVSTLYVPLQYTTLNGKKFAHRIMGFTASAEVLLQAIGEAMASNNSTEAIIFSLGYTFNTSRSLVEGHVHGWPTFDGPTDSQWFLHQIPSKLCQEMIIEAEGRCNESDDNCSNAIAFEKDDYVAAAVIVSSKTMPPLLLLQYTPRDFFYAAGDRTRSTGIIIGVFAALAVVLSCILVWCAISRPLKSLQGNMDLAADMRNDEVSTTTPMLTEIASLTRCFNAMNNKLLAARPFLPQSLLQGMDCEVVEGEEEESIVEEASFAAASSVVGSGVAGMRGSTIHHRSIVSGGDRESMSFRTQSSTEHKGRARNTQLTNSKLMQRRVAILCVNVRDFTGAARDAGLQPEQLNAAHTALLGQVQTTAQAAGGIVDFFHGDHFVCTFNTAKHCAAPGRCGAACSSALRSSFIDSASMSLFPKGLAMGVATGRALVGNMGTSTMKRLSTVGPVFTEAMALQDVMSGVGGENCALVTGTMLPDIELAVLFELYGVVPSERLARGLQLRNLAEYTKQINMPFGSLRTKEYLSVGPNCVSPPWDTTRHVMVALVRRCDSVATTDEWMYELQDMQSKNPYKKDNAILSEFFFNGICPEMILSEKEGACSTLYDRIARKATEEYVL